jgi:hypothetical protein
MSFNGTIESAPSFNERPNDAQLRLSSIESANDGLLTAKLNWVEEEKKACRFRSLKDSRPRKFNSTDSPSGWRNAPAKSRDGFDPERDDVEDTG